MSLPVKGPDRMVTHNAVKIQLAGIRQVYVRATGQNDIDPPCGQVKMWDVCERLTSVRF